MSDKIKFKGIGYVVTRSGEASPFVAMFDEEQLPEKFRDTPVIGDVKGSYRKMYTLWNDDAIGHMDKFFKYSFHYYL
jgi:hypothetical protein